MFRLKGKDVTKLSRVPIVERWFPLVHPYRGDTRCAAIRRETFIGICTSNAPRSARAGAAVGNDDTLEAATRKKGFYFAVVSSWGRRKQSYPSRLRCLGR